MYTLDGVRVRYDLKYNWEDTICIHVSYTVCIPLQVMWQSCDRVYGHMTCLDGNSLCRVVIYHRHRPFKHLNHTIDLLYTQTADTQIYVTIKQCWCHEDNVFHLYMYMYYHITIRHSHMTITWPVLLTVTALLPWTILISASEESWRRQWWRRENGEWNFSIWRCSGNIEWGQFTKFITEYYLLNYILCIHSVYERATHTHMHANTSAHAHAYSHTRAQTQYKQWSSYMYIPCLCTLPSLSQNIIYWTTVWVKKNGHK